MFFVYFKKMQKLFNTFYKVNLTYLSQKSHQFTMKNKKKNITYTYINYCNGLRRLAVKATYLLSFLSNITFMNKKYT